MLKIGITGFKGKIGSLLAEELRSDNWPGTEYVGGTERHDDPEELFKRADAVIDFTSAEASIAHAKLAAKHQKILIAASSGFSEEQEKELQAAGTSGTIIYATNTSVGVNMLYALTRQAASVLDGKNWDAEIIDAHHRFKKDAPSGTSYALAKEIEAGRGTEAQRTHTREGLTGPREEGTIGFSVQRGGDDVIENTVIYYGNGERLEITHRATNRAIFAKGAIKAALWAQDKPAGFYTMKDVLGL